MPQNLPLQEVAHSGVVASAKPVTLCPRMTMDSASTGAQAS
jgi:hypothetical protein